MKLKALRLKFQALGLRSLLNGVDYDKDGVDVKRTKNVKKPSWKMPITHGYHLVEDQSWHGEDEELQRPDNVVVQREEMGNLELWFFCVSDARIGDGISKFLLSNFFGKNLKESVVSRKGKEILKQGHLSARAKFQGDNVEKAVEVGCVSAMVVNGERIMMAQMGGYRAIVCKDGMAHQLRATYKHRGKRRWPRWLFSGAIHTVKVRIQACHARSKPSRKQTNSPELIVSTERIDSETEFIILASTGISEVMRNQEAVDLISHIDDPQEAAECLAKEALMRMSKSIISCLVIRFD